MSTYSLTFIPYNKSSFTLDLLENVASDASVEALLAVKAEKNSIFSDLSYQFLLNCSNITDIQDIQVYINDTFEPCTFVHEKGTGKISFPKEKISDRRIFIDCYGFVELSLILFFHDSTTQTLRTGYLPVLVQKGTLNTAVAAMVKYVYEHQDILLLTGESKSRNTAELKENSYKNLTTQIILAQEIATLYESNYGYFKANSRSHIEKVPVIDQLERLQYVTPATLQYIVSHPEQLKPVNSNAGIHIRNRTYQPQKTLCLQNVNSHNIYENRVILGFLRKMISEIGQLQELCKNLLYKIPKDEEHSTGYIYSSFFMFAETRRVLEQTAKQLAQLYNRYAQLWNMYKTILPISADMLSIRPQPTAVFLSIPQYNQIFTRIHKWFSFGIYDFSKESYMLSFLKISELYEHYLLAKMAVYFIDHGYTMSAEQCTYPVPPKWKYKNTAGVNTFHFSNGNTNLTLYYQPVIFHTDQRAVNGIGLYRNNSIPAFIHNNQLHEGYYYTPDYILKVETKIGAKYLILDAKFSDLETVKKHYIKDLAFKYLFSISTISATDTAMGMCILYGKCTAHEQLQSTYNHMLSGQTILPLAEILPLMESIASEKQYHKLDTLFKMLLE